MIKHLRSPVGVVRGSDPFLMVGCPLQSRCPPADWEAACMEVGKTCALPPDSKVCGGKGRVRLPCQEQGSGGRFLGMQGAACTPLLGAMTAVGASRGGPRSTAPLLLLSPPKPWGRNVHLPGSAGLEVGWFQAHRLLLLQLG